MIATLLFLCRSNSRFKTKFISTDHEISKPNQLLLKLFLKKYYQEDTCTSNSHRLAPTAIALC